MGSAVFTLETPRRVVSTPFLPSPFTLVLLLGIETATNICSVALLQGMELLAELSVDEPRSHASQLVPLVQRVLQDHGKTPADLDVIAISAGPGSYTGLRIGASTAKGLAFATDAALVAVPTLEALAQAAQAGQPEAEQPVLVVLPSRRDEVYAAVYIMESDGLAAVREPEAVELADLFGWLPARELRLVWPATQTVLDATPDSDRFLVTNATPSAVHVAKLGLEPFNDGRTQNVASWEPYYLKAFVAKPPRPIFGA